jgi:hypothetical protein
MAESDITFPESGITPPQPLAPEPVFAGLSEQGIDFGVYKINTANVDYYYRTLQNTLRVGTRMVETLFDVSQKKLRLEANQKKEQANLRIRAITAEERRYTEEMRSKEIAMRMRLLTESAGYREETAKKEGWRGMMNAWIKAREDEEREADKAAREAAAALRAKNTYLDREAKDEIERMEREAEERAIQEAEDAFRESRR